MQPSSLKVGEDVQIGGKVIKIQQRLGNGAFGVVYKVEDLQVNSGVPNENIVQNLLNIALLNVFWYLNGRYRHTFIP